MTEQKLAVVQEGLFLVSPKGLVFKQCRDNENTYHVANQHTIRHSNSYQIVSATVNGKQNNYYVHHLIAEGFLPNPDNLPQLIYIDGDQSNNCVDNLMWGTNQTRVKHSLKLGKRETLETTDKRCPKCEEPTLAEPLCTQCKVKMTQLKIKLQRRQKRREPYRIPFKHINQYKYRYRVVVRRLYRGDSGTDIGEQLGYTRQYVSILAQHIRKGDPRAYKVDPLKVKEHTNVV